MPCLIVFICLGLSSKKYNIGVSSEAKYAVKPKKQSQGGLSGATSSPGPTGLPGNVEGKQKEAG